ncbi:GNAT family N-acetyltransferase [Caldimonas brevitalea]|uniref:GNAT family acetyltransferase n=1 Tax=Caldimonas brevitalea TaxID=413882 RepID=A0A0G3BRV8_9BURK|nr:GNAT family N-acetyltransferase [Caldimonas brevitalea]AKJ30121.1 GNAT family acetyltransferase [Caldimonas brevitalea]
MPPHIVPLQPDHRDAWERLARGYKDFYRTPTSDEEYEAAWQRLLQQRDVFGLGAVLDGQLVGLAHYLFHGSTWSPRVCYLQDLFTSPEARGQGVARMLIEAVADEARRHGAARYYWLTQEHNETARKLYDQVAKYNGFIRYDQTL